MEETPPLPPEAPAETPDLGVNPMPVETPAEEAAAQTAPEAPAEAPAPEPAGEASAPEPTGEAAASEPAPEAETAAETEPTAAAPAQPADLSPVACAAALAERFPALFAAGRPLPIKLRIQADIQARAPGVFSKKSLSIFLHRHTTSTAYIRALLDAQTRFDLDGQAAGEIATEHREAAVVELERRRQIVMAKRQAERDAQRAAQREAQMAARPTQALAQAEPQPQPQPDGSAARPEQVPRPPRANRPDRPDRPARPPQPNRPNQAPRGDRPPRPQARFERPPQAPRPPQGAQPQRERDSHPERPAAPPQTPLTPEQAAEHEARRARATLLRAFETSTLSRANFCTLKRIDDATLEAQLQQARAERGDRGTASAPRR